MPPNIYRSGSKIDGDSPLEFKRLGQIGSNFSCEPLNRILSGVPRGCEALPAGCEALPSGSKAPRAGSKAHAASSAGSENLPVVLP